MRYTRYEYKKSGNFKFLLAVVVVAALSVGGGLYISNVIFGNEEAVDKNMSSYSSEQVSNKIGSSNVVAIQCGFYSKKENADALVSSISQYCHPFIIDENGSYRVIAGIYNEEDSQKKIQELQGKGIEVAKTTITLKADTSDDKKIIEITDGFLKIMSKFEESDVSSVKTSEFKNWCNDVMNEEGQAQGDKLKQVNNYVQNLPEQVDKSNNSEAAYGFYNLIKE
ncbi:MAG: SPOR domain-containing protein [Clostridium sp.]|nr:SPOR domain-containing protein [Clostridium sp.]